MGILFDIVDKVVPRVMKREYENGKLKEVIEEELKKEIGQTIEKETNTTKNTLL